jgi:hypothetical protein
MSATLCWTRRVARDSFRHAAGQKMRDPAAAVRRAEGQVNVSAAREVGYLAHWRFDAHFGARLLWRARNRAAAGRVAT